MSELLSFKSLGRCEYGETLHMMRSHISNEDFKNEIWFLEHPPIFTLGTAADQKHILNAKGIPVIQSDRGGEVTYHGPGQLVIYFMIDVKRSKLGPKILVKTLQEFTKSLLKEYSIDSEFIDGAPGVYVNEKKIAGVLIENSIRAKKLQKSIVGIGINVNNNCLEIKSAISIKEVLNTDTSMKELLSTLCQELEKYYLLFRNDKTGAEFTACGSIVCGSVFDAHLNDSAEALATPSKIAPLTSAELDRIRIFMICPLNCYR